MCHLVIVIPFVWLYWKLEIVVPLLINRLSSIIDIFPDPINQPSNRGPENACQMKFPPCTVPLAATTPLGVLSASVTVRRRF
jgi:hypothetical protein